MQNQTVQIFESTLFGSLTTIIDNNGAPWFVGRQVAEKLGYVRNNPDQNISNALNRHCPDSQPLSNLTENRLGIRASSKMISEADLYRLVMNSTLEGAQAFQDWVVSEVLPSIRNHGGYGVEQPTMAEQYASPELFNQVHTSIAAMNETLVSLVGAVASLTNLVVTNQQSNASEEDQIPEGYKRHKQIFAEQRLALGGNSFNENALKRILSAVSWPTVRFNQYNKDGVLVPVSYYKPVSFYKSRNYSLIEFLRVVVGESVMVGEYSYSHPLIGNYRR